MKQSHHHLSLNIQVRPEAAWQVIGGADGVDKWFAPVTSCRVVGNKRFCETADGAFSEDILEINNESMTFKYAIPSQNLLPISNILGTMQVSNAEDGNTSVSWSWHFEVEEAAEQQAIEALDMMGNMGIKGIESMILAEETASNY